jgi:hypothetical protein
MREGVRFVVFEVIVQIVDVEVAIGEGFSGRNVEIANYFVDLDTAF